MVNLYQLAREAAAAEGARLRAGLARLAASAILLLCAGAVAVIGFVFLLVGVYASLVDVLPAWQAGGAVALAVLAIAGLLVLLSRRSAAPAPAVPPPPRETEPTDAQQAVADGRRAGEALRRSGVTTTDLALAAFVAGLVTSRRTGERARRPTADRR